MNENLMIEFFRLMMLETFDAIKKEQVSVRDYADDRLDQAIAVALDTKDKDIITIVLKEKLRRLGTA